MVMYECIREKVLGRDDHGSFAVWYVSFSLNTILSIFCVIGV